MHLKLTYMKSKLKPKAKSVRIISFDKLNIEKTNQNLSYHNSVNIWLFDMVGV